MNRTVVAGAILLSVFGVKAVASDTQITLLPGWNLVSLPEMPSTSDTSSLLSGSTVKTLYKYKGGTWSSYTPSNARSQPFRMYAQNGYWMYVDEAESESVLTVSGSSADVSHYGSLSAGWNLVAVGADTSSADFATASSAAGNNISTIYSYDTAASSWASHTPSNARSQAITMVPGSGYWAYVDEENSGSSPATGMVDVSSVYSDEGKVSSSVAPDGKALRVFVSAVADMGTDAVTAGETTYNIPALPVAVYANSAVDNDTSVIVDSAYAGEKVVMQLTDTTSGAVTYTSIAALDSAGGVNASGTTDDSGQAGTFE